MPLYEFRCPVGHDFEKFYRSIAAAPSEEKCPECGERSARLMSTAGLVFKGSGFYITDYGKDGKKAEREAASKSGEKSTKADAPADKTAAAESSGPGGKEAGPAPKEATPPPKPAPAPPTSSAPPAAKPTSSPANKASGNSR